MDGSGDAYLITFIKKKRNVRENVATDAQTKFVRQRSAVLEPSHLVSFLLAR